MTRRIDPRDHVPTDFDLPFRPFAWGGRWKPLFNGGFDGWSALNEWTDARDERWVPVPPGETPKHCEIIDNGFVVDAQDGGWHLTTGDVQWRNFELSLLVTPIAGDGHEIGFRVDDSEGLHRLPSNYLSMRPDDSAVGVYRAAHGWVTCLSAVHYPIEHGRQYAVTIMVFDQSITTYINGALVNQVTDGECLRGRFTVGVNHSKCLFQDIKCRVKLDLPSLPQEYIERWRDEANLPWDHRFVRYLNLEAGQQRDDS